MKEILLNPGVLALIGTIILSAGAGIRWVYSTKLGLKAKENEKEEQKERSLLWHTEMYHRLRSYCGNNHGWDKLDENERFPMFPPDEVIKGK